MEDLFAQKDVGLFLGHLCPQRPFGFIVLLVCLDGRGGAAQLDWKVSSAIAGLWSSFPSAAADDSGITGDEETESMWDAPVLEQQVSLSRIASPDFVENISEDAL